MGDVVGFRGVTRLDIDPARVLAEAQAAGLTAVVITGYDADGNEYFASSVADGANVLWLLARMQKRLLEVVDGA